MTSNHFIIKLILSNDSHDPPLEKYFQNFHRNEPSSHRLFHTKL